MSDILSDHDHDDDHVSKRVKLLNDDGQMVIYESCHEAEAARSSHLWSSRIQLEGHRQEVLDVKFSKDGSKVASCSLDGTVNLWTVYENPPQNYGVIQIPKGKPTCLKWVSEEDILVGTSEGQLVHYSANTGEILKKYDSGKDIINALDIRQPVLGVGANEAGDFIIVSASDDGLVRVFNSEKKNPIDEVELGYPILDVCWYGEKILIAGLDNDVHVYSRENQDIEYSLSLHTDSITGLSLQISNKQLASVGMDSMVNIWNVAPFAPLVNEMDSTQSPRLIKSLFGAPSGIEAYSRRISWTRHGKNASIVACGGADKAVTIWDTETGQMIVKLGGRLGTVISVDWSPREAIIASGSTDGSIVIEEVLL